jgi:DNA-binding beta-propeller fold protein YncE
MTLRLSGAILCLAVCSAARAQDAAASMKYPLAVVADAAGVVYVADLRLPGIWKITDGKAEVFFRGSNRFRTPLNAVRCLAVEADGSLLAGDSATREIYRFGSDAKPTPLTHGYIGIPSAIAVGQDGAIYVSDLEAQRIWSFPKEGLKQGEDPKEVAVVAGIRGLAFGPDGKLLFSTTIEDPIRRVGDDGVIEVLVKGRPFDMPHHLVVGGDGTMYVTDNYKAAVWKVPAGGGDPTALVQGPPLNKPVGLGKRGEELLVADPHARTIFTLTLDGKLTSLYQAK